MKTLMSSISGIRGIVGNGLEPEVILKYTSAFGDLVGKGKVIVGRDARITGEMVSDLVTGTLLAKGIDVVDIGICPTPTVQLMVKKFNADGGIAISASHNPNEWNALKLLNKTGQFLSPEEYKNFVTKLNDETKYSDWKSIGEKTFYDKAIDDHIEAVLNLKIIDVEKMREKKFKVLVDCVNGAGVYALPKLLKALGCEVIEFNCEKTGIFPRLPEPLPENLVDTMKAVRENKADLGIVVDPDADRLVLITDKAETFGEENTITVASKLVLSKTKGNVVVNLSTTRAVDDVAKQYDSKVYRSPVGEANVIEKMKEVNAVIGGEGSGGVIYPELHYGRDSLAGTVLILQLLSEEDVSLSNVKKNLPAYFIKKKKTDLGNSSPDEIIEKLKQEFESEKINTDDGLRIDFDDHWVHFRKSNTEPILRIICESGSEQKSEELIQEYFSLIDKLF